MFQTTNQYLVAKLIFPYFSPKKTFQMILSGTGHIICGPSQAVHVFHQGETPDPKPCSARSEVRVTGNPWEDDFDGKAHGKPQEIQVKYHKTMVFPMKSGVFQVVPAIFPTNPWDKVEDHGAVRCQASGNSTSPETLKILELLKIPCWHNDAFQCISMHFNAFHHVS